MRRREFLVRAGKAAGAALASTGAGWVLSQREPSGLVVKEAIRDFSVAAEDSLPQMAIARGVDIPSMVARVLEALGGVERFISKGDRVLIKPNAAFDRPSRLGATTSPEVIEALVRCCLQAGADRVWVTDNPINSPERCFQRSGIQEAVSRAGGEILLPLASQFETVDLKGWVLERWPILAGPLRQATKLIGVPTVKEHNLCGASLSMKNWYGFLGEGRNRLHQNIHEAIADLGMAFKPTLVVMDATRLLMQNGPTGGSPSDVVPGNAIAAGTDQVALDAFGAELLQRTQDCRYLDLAAERGLGQSDWRSLKVQEVTV